MLYIVGGICLLIGFTVGVFAALRTHPNPFVESFRADHGQDDTTPVSVHKGPLIVRIGWKDYVIANGVNHQGRAALNCVWVGDIRKERGIDCPIEALETVTSEEEQCARALAQIEFRDLQSIREFQSVLERLARIAKAIEEGAKVGELERKKADFQ